MQSSEEFIDTTEYSSSHSFIEEERHEEEELEEPVDPRSLLTQEQLQQFKNIFTALDTAGNGIIPVKLLGIVIRSLGFNPTKRKVREYMLVADPEGKGQMDFQGFLLPLAEIINTVPETLDDILAAFKTLDESDQGYISVNELYEYLTALGESLEDFEIELLIKMADPKGEGKIMYEEFLERVIGVPKKKKSDKKGGKKKK